jgi:hypothetical protein
MISALSNVTRWRRSALWSLACDARDGRYLVLTHLIPPVGADQQYPFKVPGKPLTEEKAARDGGFTGNVIVGIDLAGVRLLGK